MIYIIKNSFFVKKSKTKLSNTFKISLLQYFNCFFKPKTLKINSKNSI